MLKDGDREDENPRSPAGTDSKHRLRMFAAIGASLKFRCPMPIPSAGCIPERGAGDIDTVNAGKALAENPGQGAAAASPFEGLGFPRGGCMPAETVFQKALVELSVFHPTLPFPASGAAPVGLVPDSVVIGAHPPVMTRFTVRIIGLCRACPAESPFQPWYHVTPSFPS